MHFHSPWAFLLLIPVAGVLFLQHMKWKKRGSIRFSSVGNAVKAGRSFRQRLSVLQLVLRILAVLCLVIAIARPQSGRQRVQDVSKGVAIEMVVDRSGSMGTEMEYQGKNITRLDVVKKVFLDFALGNNGTLPGRSNDLIGMIAYARYPSTVCPLTLAHGALPLFVKNTKLVTQRSEDGTAIGDALALAAARLKTAESTLKKQQSENKTEYQIKSKIIILLSDGRNNTGERTPLEAAELAKKWGIKVHTIAIGGEGDAMTSVRTPLGVFKMPAGVEVDTTTLKSIADTTGGVFYEADDARSLKAIYQNIDKMEKSEIESVRYVDYREDFLPFALAALLLIAFEILLSSTLFRKIP
jgi:Ca-activated chloride channel family protein